MASLAEKPAPEIAAAATEQINERSLDLEKLSPREFVNLFVAEEKFVQDALRAAAASLAEGVAVVAAALKNNGRLFYVGAGTSGRLGVLDASEIPPTFGAPAELVQGIIAGGAEALHRSVEARKTMPRLAPSRLSNAASPCKTCLRNLRQWPTPFVLGAAAPSVRRGTLLDLLSGRRLLANEFDRDRSPTGPELLGFNAIEGWHSDGVLNILSTGAMVQLGHVTAI